MVYLKTFQLNEYRSRNQNLYPFNVLKGKEPEVFVFEAITVLYGNNGSGKSTILNLIAHTLNLKGKERNEPKLPGMDPNGYEDKYIDFETYAKLCEYGVAQDEFGRKRAIPENSRYIKSEEILYEIRKIQQDAILEEGIESNLARERGLQETKKFLRTKEGEKQFARFQFAQDRYSNGETTLQILSETIEPDNLYLLDEPEVSLSPQKQVELANELNKLARYLGVQFIIATHSPFMLGILEAKIYNLDTKNYEVQKWTQLENVKYFYEFFKKREKEFEE